ncbi:YhcN/YlaJ family sporulation lipoprotein [Caldibacillus debilis]|uniref:YhcN/YlaJ family sporulation lipoprotein n=1 Tax=Caldibacillus debilis TaxID=301148 RepID=UPI00037A6B80|nr:YhcN/YlaJ family sporulation lipoprotein [Caldibacillus debilis]
MKKLVLMFLLTAASFSLIGCMNGDQDQNEQTSRNRDNTLNVNDQRDGRNAWDFTGNGRNGNGPNTVNNPDMTNDNGRYGADNNGNNRYAVAEEAARQVADLKEVDTANVICTDRNAYVAVVLDDNVDRLSKRLEEKIADRVRRADTSIDNVYVSANPDFAQRMNDYAQKINNGEPIQGFAEEFNEMVRRVFPNAR